VRHLALPGTACFLLAVGAASACADWRITPYRPAIDAIGDAEPPAMEGVAALPDGVEFAPDLPHGRGRVVIDASAPPPSANGHFKRRRAWVIER